MKQQKKKADLNGVSLNSYLAELFTAYRAIGLFKQYDNFSSEELQEKAKKYVFEEFGFRPEKLFANARLRSIIDILVLTLDTQRVWVRDTKDEVSAEEKRYEETLMQWSNISDGHFQPSDIREIWDEEEDRIYVDMVERGRYKRAQLDILPGILDVGNLVRQVNELFDCEPYKFQVIGLGDIALVIMLTEEQRARLQSERSQEFVSTEELEGFPPAKMKLYLKNFRKVFNKWRFFEFILFIVAAIDIGYFSYRGLKAASGYIAAGRADSEYLLAADKFFWVFVAIFIGIILGGYLERALLRIILKDKNEGYNIYLQMFCGEGELSSRILKYLSIIIGSAAAVFIFLGMNWYILFTDSEIIINPLWSLKETRYEYSEVQSVNQVEKLEKIGKRTFEREFIKITFKDGTTWESNSEGRTPSNYLDEEIVEFVSKKSGKAVDFSH